eukprot:2236665-Rhodomonas_salina.1
MEEGVGLLPDRLNVKPDAQHDEHNNKHMCTHSEGDILSSTGRIAPSGVPTGVGVRCKADFGG